MSGPAKGTPYKERVIMGTDKFRRCQHTGFGWVPAVPLRCPSCEALNAVIDDAIKRAQGR